MGKITGRGNLEMRQKIEQQSGSTLEFMHAAREQNPFAVYRTCSLEEAVNTWFYCLAGGEYRNLERQCPTETQSVQQVGNSESMSNPSKKDKRAEVLRKLKEKTGVNINVSVTPRDVVEYSKLPTGLKMNGIQIKAKVNRAYTKTGSLAPNEGGGVVIQIGTPLMEVEIEESLLQEAPINHNLVA